MLLLLYPLSQSMSTEGQKTDMVKLWPVLRPVMFPHVPTLWLQCMMSTLATGSNLEKLSKAELHALCIAGVSSARSGSSA